VEKTCLKTSSKVFLRGSARKRSKFRATKAGRVVTSAAVCFEGVDGPNMDRAADAREQGQCGTVIAKS